MEINDELRSLRQLAWTWIKRCDDITPTKFQGNECEPAKNGGSGVGDSVLFSAILHYSGEDWAGESVQITIQSLLEAPEATLRLLWQLMANVTELINSLLHPSKRTQTSTLGWLSGKSPLPSSIIYIARMTTFKEFKDGKSILQTTFMYSARDYSYYFYFPSSI